VRDRREYMLHEQAMQLKKQQQPWLTERGRKSQGIVKRVLKGNKSSKTQKKKKKCMFNPEQVKEVRERLNLFYQ